MARNSIVLGALGAAVGFVAVLSHEAAFPPIVQRLAEQVFGPPVAGLALAILFSLPGSRVPASEGVVTDAPPAAERTAGDPRSGRWPQIEAGLGYLLLAALLAQVLLLPADRPGPRPIDWLLHGPAWLAVAAGALALAVYGGGIRSPSSVTLALGRAGATGALFGVLRALHGFSDSRVEAVAGGLVFAFSACVATLVGLAAAGLPREDRALGQPTGMPSRIVWYGFPFLTLLVVTVAWLLVSTPMKMRP
jgi:hypothetical protein